MEPEPTFVVRPATHKDVLGINAILTYYAIETVITFATTALSDSAVSAKLDNITLENHLPFHVATTRPESLTLPSRDPESTLSHEVLGICYVSPYRPERLAYSNTGELTLMVHHEHYSKGIGSALLRSVIYATRPTRIRELLAVMAVDETGPGKGLVLRDYYRRWGFREVGRLEKVGFKFDRWIDVITLQLHIDPN